MQPDPHFAVTLQAGYSVAIFLPNGSGSAEALHFIPLGLEAVVTPVPRLDLAARFFLDGLLGGTATTGSLPGYFELRELMFWIRVHS
jgi:hypothetical protein